jgi:hypothetical protein
MIAPENDVAFACTGLFSTPAALECPAAPKISAASNVPSLKQVPSELQPSSRPPAQQLTPPTALPAAPVLTPRGSMTFTQQTSYTYDVASMHPPQPPMHFMQPVPAPLSADFSQHWPRHPPQQATGHLPSIPLTQSNTQAHSMPTMQQEPAWYGYRQNPQQQQQAQFLHQRAFSQLFQPQVLM